MNSQPIALTDHQPTGRWSSFWLVNSHSDPNKSYVVARARSGEFGCSCPVWIYRRKECKHIASVRNFLQQGRAAQVSIRTLTPAQQATVEKVLSRFALIEI